MASLLRRLGKRAALRTPILRAVVSERDELRWRLSNLATPAAQTAAVTAAVPAPTPTPSAPLPVALTPDQVVTPPDASERDKWFWDHYTWAVDRMNEFLAAGGLGLAGRQVADVGCGDGIIDLGVAHKCAPARLVCFDIKPTDTNALQTRAKSQGVPADTLPPCLEFRVSEPILLPAEDASFDLVFSWSAFEHIADPIGVLREIRRVLRPDGAFFMTLWPFYYSQHGSHLQDWFPEGFVHLYRSPAEIEEAVRANAAKGAAEFMLSEFSKLNRITLDDLQRSILAAGFAITRAEIWTQPFSVPPELAHFSLSLLGTSGVQLVASPRSERVPTSR